MSDGAGDLAADSPEMRGLAAPALAAALAMSSASAGGPSALPGWAFDDHAEALAVWRATCDVAHPLCREAADAANARAFWEEGFTLGPVLGEVLVTGYYEPVLDARRRPDNRFTVPLLALPEDPALASAHDRAAIGAGALSGLGLELFWLNDPVAAFFLHVQGSGRLRLADGSLARVGYAGRNGHAYVSIGRLMAQSEGVAPQDITAQRLMDWLRADPARGRAVMEANPSYIFFAERTDLAPEHGPIGASGVPLTALRSLAFDPAHMAPGSAAWLETEVPQPGGGSRAFRGLIVAQDTGSAIRGPTRADLFFGTGAEAGALAGRMRAPGRLTLLRPRGPGAP